MPALPEVRTKHTSCDRLGQTWRSGSRWRENGGVGAEGEDLAFEGRVAVGEETRLGSKLGGRPRRLLLRQRPAELQNALSACPKTFPVSQTRKLASKRAYRRMFVAEAPSLIWAIEMRRVRFEFDVQAIVLSAGDVVGREAVGLGALDAGAARLLADVAFLRSRPGSRKAAEGRKWRGDARASSVASECPGHHRSVPCTWHCSPPSRGRGWRRSDEPIDSRSSA